MNPREISQQLPNGFHGAIVEGISIDLGRKAEFTMKLLVPDQNITGRSRRRRGKFQVEDLAFLSLDVPDPHYDYASKSGLEIADYWIRQKRFVPIFPLSNVNLDLLSFFIASSSRSGTVLSISQGSTLFSIGLKVE